MFETPIDFVVLYFSAEDKNRTEFMALKLELNNKYTCGLGKKIVWKKKRKDGGTFEKVKLDEDHFVDSKNSFIISSAKKLDEGDYLAVDADSPDLIAAKYSVDVYTGLYSVVQQFFKNVSKKC